MLNARHSEHSDGGEMHMSMAHMSMQDMQMIFYSDTTTTLYSGMWTPTTVGLYAGTCIFLIVLAALFRGSFALRSSLERIWFARALQRRYVVLADKLPASERIQQNPQASTAVLTANGIEENVRVVRQPSGGAQPWRFSVDLPRAAIVMAQAGVGYLLMLAVMTMNVGYFMSVLAGTFVGELAAGRYAAVASDH